MIDHLIDVGILTHDAELAGGRVVRTRWVTDWTLAPLEPFTPIAAVFDVASA